MAKKTKKKERCAYCNSDKVQTKMWVEVNTDRPMDIVSVGEYEDNWCPKCESNCDIVTK